MSQNQKKIRNLQIKKVKESFSEPIQRGAPNIVFFVNSVEKMQEVLNKLVSPVDGKFRTMKIIQEELFQSWRIEYPELTRAAVKRCLHKAQETLIANNPILDLAVLRMSVDNMILNSYNKAVDKDDHVGMLNAARARAELYGIKQANKITAKVDRLIKEELPKLGEIVNVRLEKKKDD